jgi:hypothetical protein
MNRSDLSLQDGPNLRRMFTIEWGRTGYVAEVDFRPMKPSYMPIKQGFRLRLMSHLGCYPTESLRSESASLIVSPEICFSIVRVQREEWSFAELDCLTELELPLFGSVLLAGEAGATYLYPYLTTYSVLLQTESFRKIDESCILECKSFLLESIRENSEGSSANSFHKPPALGGRQYEFIATGSYSDWHSILRRLEGANPVILRGVSCLIKAKMAFQHRELGEAACIHLWIALDAAHSLILQRLRDTGIVNPTSADAARYFERITGYETDWDKFFENDYDNRIRAIHPDNRFGAEAIPQLTADDFFELYDELVPLFSCLVSQLPDTSAQSVRR